MSPEMKNYINKLKAECDFREEGLKGYKQTILNWTLLLFIPSWALAMKIAEKNNQEFDFVFFLIIYSIIIFFYRLLYSFVRKPIWLYEEGNFSKGIILESRYDPIWLPTKYGWVFKYLFQVGQQEYLKKVILPKGSKRFFGNDYGPIKDAEIIVFWDRQNPDKNTPFMLNHFSKNCLSKSRFTEIMNQYYQLNR